MATESVAALVSVAIEIGTNDVWGCASAGGDEAGGCMAKSDAVIEPLNKSEVGDSRGSKGSTSN